MRLVIEKKRKKLLIGFVFWLASWQLELRRENKRKQSWLRRHTRKPKRKEVWQGKTKDRGRRGFLSFFFGNLARGRKGKDVSFWLVDRK